MAKTSGARRSLGRILILLALLAFCACAFLVYLSFDPASGMTGAMGAIAALAVAAGGALYAGIVLLDHHFDDLERLRGALMVAASREEPLPPDWPPLGEAGPEAKALGAAAARAINAHRALGGQTDEKMATIVGAAAEGLLVATDNGLVSLVNAAAQNFFGGEAVRVGTSVYAVLERDGMAELEREVQDAGEAIAVDLPHVDGRSISAIMAPLGDHGGYVLSLPHREPGRINAVEHDLTLHDRPPEVSLDPGSVANWPLEDLPVLVMDSETTGLDVAIDRIVSLGAVRSHGWRLYPHANMDSLVNPSVPIPRLSTAIHGITDAMVAAAPGFANAWPDVRKMMDGNVVIGHSIGFDLAILKRECERYGISWKTPSALDTSLLFSALEPRETDLNLERLASRYGVEIEGRHTALGDALVTAEVWLAMIPQLIDRGIRTYGEARRFSDNAKAMLAQQRRAGWVIVAGEESDG